MTSNQAAQESSQMQMFTRLQEAIALQQQEMLRQIERASAELG